MKAWITGWLVVAAVVCAVMVIQISVGCEQALPQAAKQVAASNLALNTKSGCLNSGGVWTTYKGQLGCMLKDFKLVHSIWTPQATKQAKPQDGYAAIAPLHVSERGGCDKFTYSAPDGKPILTIPCDAKQPLMVAPTMRDVVTHSTELGCPKGLEQWEMYKVWLMEGTEEPSDKYDGVYVCVTPAFIAELRKAAQ